MSVATTQSQKSSFFTEEILVSVPQSLTNQRLDVTLATLLSDYSRTTIGVWIKNGWVKHHPNAKKLTDKPLKAKDKVVAGDLLMVKAKAQKNNAWLAEDIAIDVVYQDNDIIVVNKPVGLVTHPGAGNSHATLANALLHFDSQLNYLDRAGLVHRLDKNTSGLLVVARNEVARQKLIQQFKHHQIERQYVLLSMGE